MEVVAMTFDQIVRTLKKEFKLRGKTTIEKLRKIFQSTKIKHRSVCPRKNHYKVQSFKTKKQVNEPSVQ